MSDDELLDRSRTVAMVVQAGPMERQPAAIAELHALVAEARRRGDRRTYVRVLAGATGSLVASACAGYRADHLIAELRDYAREHGLWLHEVAVHAFLARQEIFAGREDNALAYAATALAALDEQGGAYPWLDEDDWHATLVATLTNVGLVLAQLGMFEQAEPLLARVQRMDRERGSAHGTTVLMINRIRLLLGWALRLERAGRQAEAAGRFGEAARIARTVEAPWPASRFPDRDRPAAQVEPIVAAAHALAEPHPRHIPVLRTLLAGARHAREFIVTAIALARCLEHQGRPSAALRVLREVSRQLVGDSSEPALALALAHDLARLSRSRTDTLAYAEALEAELWALHESRMATARTKLAHAMLDRQHRDTTRLARQDPLTGLANRLLLTETLQAADTEPGWAPVAVALVDLDGFKRVNDGESHARGDETLRTVADTLRRTMREDDVVVRYGGDEFVVLLRRTTLPAAEAAMHRVARAIAALPVARAAGVTASVGVTSLRPGDCADTVLQRADAAMYQAKRSGGNRVHASY